MYGHAQCLSSAEHLANKPLPEKQMPHVNMHINQSRYEESSSSAEHMHYISSQPAHTTQAAGSSTKRTAARQHRTLANLTAP